MRGSQPINPDASIDGTDMGRQVIRRALGLTKNTCVRLPGLTRGHGRNVVDRNTPQGVAFSHGGGPVLGMTW